VLVLGIDTALGAASAALVEDGVRLAAAQRSMVRGQQEAIAGLVQEALGAAGRPAGALDRVGVVVGPGSFTGLRVGLAFAKGFALALARPCVGVDTFAALRASAPAPGRTAVLIDAGRGQIHVEISLDGRAEAPPETLGPDALAARIAALERPLRLLGPAAAAAPPGGAAIRVLPFADPFAVAELAAAAGEPLAPPVPLYLRAPDARTLAERGRP
jgi:tRNA threonylcarbamoyladenosine biosynthesis protein TsaB